MAETGSLCFELECVDPPQPARTPSDGAPANPGRARGPPSRLRPSRLPRLGQPGAAQAGGQARGDGGGAWPG
eukprot:CAMPEP_0114518566 /NCGR_PEP_ID=MMETSP0109-20121206/18513_1 /TAXON_ID=29199 /ORGANISM="Chlorarachnion reptans, Strain CCCM449" /LENGTH=71 /DNA_ID=CAMNT_0001699197 /DNA_START=1785 /DNA_END=1997 /DNA_ORIENTATION=+